MSAEEKECKQPKVSPGIVFAFERIASLICDQAKIDYADRPYKIREWVGHLMQTFRSLTADGRFTDDDAALVAATLFNPTSVIK